MHSDVLTNKGFNTIAEYRDLTPAQFFDDIVPQQKPIVLRGFSANWPVVSAARKSHAAFVDYLLQFYRGQKARMAVAPPSANKRFHYNETMTGVNFQQGEERLDLFLARLLELVNRDIFPAITMQNAICDDILPGFTKENDSDFFGDIVPRLWLGNEGIVSAHYDGSDNVACVLAGKRQFILFPPDQTGNLYPGSLNFTPAGAPTTLVDFAMPDLEKFPLFTNAMDNAWCAELNPGDAIFIPMLWWHHVESLHKVNGLINYWWNGSSAPNAKSPTAIDSLNLALLTMSDLNPKQRDAWCYLFDHYLFHEGVAPQSYIPQHQQQILGPLTEEQVTQFVRHLIGKLTPQHNDENL